jgi:hypothetical protein
VTIGGGCGDLAIRRRRRRVERRWQPNDDRGVCPRQRPDAQIVLAVVGAIVLDHMQEPVSAAFTTAGVRL